MEGIIGKDSQLMETDRPTITRLVLAFFISPLPAPLTYYLLATLLQKTGGSLSLDNIVMIYLIGLPLSYLAVLIVGIPVYSLVILLNLRSITWYLLGGVWANNLVSHLNILRSWLLPSAFYLLGYIRSDFRYCFLYY